MSTSRYGGFHGIIFDVYGTLVDLSALERPCSTISEQPAAFSTLWRTKQLEYAVLRTVMDRYADWGQITSDALDYTATVFHAAIGPTERRDLMRAWLELPPFADVAPALQRLSGSGTRLAALSNATHQMLAPLMRHADLDRHLDLVLSSEAVQVFKPDRQIYELAAEYIPARMNELLFVTANGFDVAGAKAAGLTVCRVNRHDLPLDPLGYDPDMTVGDLGELVELLG
jgi:2-haloacid dehalogenase